MRTTIRSTRAPDGSSTRRTLHADRSRLNDPWRPKAEIPVAGETPEPVSTQRKILIALIVCSKLAYMTWFYVLGIGLNLGDTAAYIDASSSEMYLERGGIGFAYIATLIYSNPITRLFVELLTVFVLCRYVLAMKSDRNATVTTCLVLLPTSLAFMTVASKELLVFLLLCAAFRAPPLFGIPAFVVMVALKPSFAAVALLPLIRRMKFLPLYFGLTLAASAVILTFYTWANFYERGFHSYAPHFRAGNLTYESAGAFPLSPALRVLGLDLWKMELYGIAIGVMLFGVNALVFHILTKHHGFLTGLSMFLVYVAAVAPYSVHNLGSAARYQAPLACAIVLNELLTRHKRNQAGREVARSRLNPTHSTE